MFHYRETPPDVLARARRCREVCAEFGVPLAAAALRFPYLHPAVGSVVVGCRSAEEVRANAAAARTEIPPELWHRLAAEGFVPPELLEA
ncbi:L-fuco-beta-pyranose dehydrogenase [[Actinomadura] parvosata subsp. kistnae]|nr:L-fuco-beta-pyranose dehydrogenase [Actinomadura parvosata subsp. kistnae]